MPVGDTWVVFGGTFPAFGSSAPAAPMSALVQPAPVEVPWSVRWSKVPVTVVRPDRALVPPKERCTTS
ncbi:hypothetical protein ACQ86D_35765 [Streptomyces galilaeus]